MPTAFARKHGLKPFSGAKNFAAREAFLHDKETPLYSNLTVCSGNLRMLPI